MRHNRFISILALLFALTFFHAEGREAPRSPQAAPQAQEPHSATPAPHASPHPAPWHSTTQAVHATPEIHPARAAPVFERTPSMSRGERWSPTVQPRPQERPIQNIHQTHPAEMQTQLRQYVRESGLQQRLQEFNRQNLIQKQQAYKAFSPERKAENQKSVNFVREQVRNNHPNHKTWFSGQFFAGHHFRPFDRHQRDYWVHRPPWNYIYNWIGIEGSYPYYYEYNGDNYSLAVPPNLGSYVPPQEYQGEGEEYAQDQWLPIGIFAAGRTADQAAYSNLFVQLALNKDGDIAGAYYNASTNQVHPLAGTVDKQTQLVMWKVADNPGSPTMLTGLYNLTQDVIPVRVMFQDGTQQVWVLVPINE